MAAVAGGVGALAGLAGLGGCAGDLRSIDERTQRLILERSALVGPDAAPPSPRTANSRAGENDPRLFTKTPETVNPAAGELRYPSLDPRVVNEAEEVEARLAAVQSLDAQGAMVLDLAGALRQAQRTAREYLRAEEDYILAAIRLLIERHDWNPRLFAEISADFESTQVDGNIDSVLRILSEVGVTQRLPYGGEVAARWVWNATENLRSAVTGQYVQASALVLDATIPLLRDAGLIAQEALIQAERDLIYAARDFEDFRRRFVVDIARDYFGLLQLQASIRNTEKQVESFQRELERQQALNEAGLVPLFAVNDFRNQLLNSTSVLASQREAYILALDRFKIRLGLPVETPVVIEDVELFIAEPDVTPQEAARAALMYRLDLQNARDRVEDARRNVRNARNQLLPDLDLRGNVTFLTDADEDEGGVVYEPDDVRYSAGVTFGLPLDREVERLRLRQALIGLERTIREYEEFRDRIVLEARAQVREIERARFALLLAAERVKINELRIEEQLLSPERVTTRDRVDAENELNQARDAYDQAVTDLRTAVLDYLVITGQFRVGRDGEFLPLPGMEDVQADPMTPVDVPVPVGVPTELPPEIRQQGPRGAPGEQPDATPQGS